MGGGIKRIKEVKFVERIKFRMNIYVLWVYNSCKDRDRWLFDFRKSE